MGFVSQKVRNVSAGFPDLMKIKHQLSNDHAKSSAPASKIEAGCSKHNMFGASMFGFDSRYNEITVVFGNRSNNTICRVMPAL